MDSFQSFTSACIHWGKYTTRTNTHLNSVKPQNNTRVWPVSIITMHRTLILKRERSNEEAEEGKKKQEKPLHTDIQRQFKTD